MFAADAQDAPAPFLTPQEHALRAAYMSDTYADVRAPAQEAFRAAERFWLTDEYGVGIHECTPGIHNHAQTMLAGVNQSYAYALKFDARAPDAQSFLLEHYYIQESYEFERVFKQLLLNARSRAEYQGAWNYMMSYAKGTDEALFKDAIQQVLRDESILAHRDRLDDTREKRTVHEYTFSKTEQPVWTLFPNTTEAFVSDPAEGTAWTLYTAHHRALKAKKSAWKRRAFFFKSFSAFLPVVHVPARHPREWMACAYMLSEERARICVVDALGTLQHACVVRVPSSITAVAMDAQSNVALACQKSVLFVPFQKDSYMTWMCEHSLNTAVALDTENECIIVGNYHGFISTLYYTTLERAASVTHVPYNFRITQLDVSSDQKLLAQTLIHTTFFHRNETDNLVTGTFARILSSRVYGSLAFVLTKYGALKVMYTKASPLAGKSGTVPAPPELKGACLMPWYASGVWVRDDGCELVVLYGDGSVRRMNAGTPNK